MITHLFRRLLVATVPAGLALFAISTVTLGQASETVVIADGLTPAVLQVAPGTTVTWQNDDDQRRRMRSRDGPVEFDSGNLESGEAFSFTFEAEGLYPYFDQRDDEDEAYFGTVIVAASSTNGPLPATADVAIIDRSFRPGTMEAAVGATITWTNDDGEAHTVTAADGGFDSGLMAAGATFTQSFDAAGSFAYFCAIHPEMRGIVTISAESGEAPPASIEPGAGDVAPATSPDIDMVAMPVGPTTTQGISIVDFAFEPPDVEVALGSTVEWRNDDSVGHTVTATDGAFGSGVVGVAGSFSHTFDQAGVFDYFCAIHPQMTGRVTVLTAEGG